MTGLTDIDTAEQRVALSAAWDIQSLLDESERTELIVSIADLLQTTSGNAVRRGPLSLAALRVVRERIAADPATPALASELERLAGLDRWTIARQFRVAFGTSPSRFRTMRQLDLARKLIARGTHLADAAADAGFADQSHLTRQFKRAYGLTPGQWAAALVKR